MRSASAALAVALAGPAGACGLALAIGMDVSGSVDAADYRLQMDGTARALQSQRVGALLLAEAARGAPVAILVYEWSDSGRHALVSDWVLVTDRARLATLAARLTGHERRVAPDATGIGSAMAFGGQALADGPACARRVLDLTGDGRNNAPPRPELLRDAPILAEVTVNALAIGAARPDPEAPRLLDLEALAAYFEAEVIRGPGAFVERADGFAAVEAAMTRKLLREIPATALGAGPAAPAPRLAAAQ